jgi:uncharacterized protein YnzC (UPF0291/DUF896 family)
MDPKAKKPPEDQDHPEITSKIITTVVISVVLATSIMLSPPFPHRFVWAMYAATLFSLLAFFTYFLAKRTMWELLQVFLVPVALVGLTSYYTAQVDVRQQTIEEKRAQDTALQAYLDQMGTLVLEDLTNPKVRTLLRARTLTVLERLDPNRKKEVMQFLLEAGLVSGVDERDPVIDLHGANLSGTDLRNADLRGAKLSDADLTDANLRGADLHGTDLRDAKLTDANLSKVEGVTNEELKQQAASLQGATMPNGQKY